MSRGQADESHMMYQAAMSMRSPHGSRFRSDGEARSSPRSHRAGEKPRSYHGQVVARWSKEGRIRRTRRGMYEKT